MSNPFEDNQNAWSNNDGPRYGNAYESTPTPPAVPALPPRKNNNSTNKTQVPNSPFQTQRMPSPSAYNNNAWAAESNKTLEEARNSPVPAPINAYQYSGTPYGNSPQMTNTSVDNSNKEHKPHKIEAPMSIADSPMGRDTASLPSKIRLGLRVTLFIAAVGHLGFAAGASPVSYTLLFVTKKEIKFFY